MKECVQETAALQEVDQFCVQSTAIDRADDEVREYKRRDKGKLGNVAARALREIDNDTQNAETSGSDSSSTRGKASIDQVNNVQGDENSIRFAEKQQLKRKRTIMNDRQTGLVEKALLDMPDMHRDAASLKLWADRLSEHV